MPLLGEDDHTDRHVACKHPITAGDACLPKTSVEVDQATQIGTSREKYHRKATAKRWSQANIPYIMDRKSLPDQEVNNGGGSIRSSSNQEQVFSRNHHILEILLFSKTVALYRIRVPLP